jgi:hypothetical protein
MTLRYIAMASFEITTYYSQRENSNRCKFDFMRQLLMIKPVPDFSLQILRNQMTIMFICFSAVLCFLPPSIHAPQSPSLPYPPALQGGVGRTQGHFPIRAHVCRSCQSSKGHSKDISMSNISFNYFHFMLSNFCIK